MLILRTPLGVMGNLFENLIKNSLKLKNGFSEDYINRKVLIRNILVSLCPISNNYTLCELFQISERSL